jgi:enoyl-CoA hydratase/carnithine racemase
MGTTYENHFVLVDKRDTAVALLTLNDPPLNLNSIPSLQEFGDTLHKLAADPEVRVLVLTGAGAKAFCAGSDISGFKEMAGDFIGKKFKLEMDVMNSLEFIDKPTICAVEGYCMGGGLEVACCCDLRIVSEKALFSQPEISLGLYPASGGLYRLPKLIGPARALEMMYLGEAINAEEAYRIGLVNKIAPVGSAVEESLNLAARIARKAPNALRVIKEGVRKMWLKESKDNHYTNLEYIEGIFNHHNGVEGVAAFLEKRKPRFDYTDPE